MEGNAEAESTLIYRRSDNTDDGRGLVPEDLRAWIPAVRLVKLVQDLAIKLPPDAAPNDDARHLSAVLLWCLATGRYGSWDIEALCDEEPLCRHLAGKTSPSHADIHRFRRDHEPALQAVLANVFSVAAPSSISVVVDYWAAEAARRFERAREADQGDER